MAYTKQTWTDLPSKTTPINAQRLGHIEQGIYDAAATADTAAENAASAVSGLADKVDKVAGKELSTNDYDNTAKAIVDAVTNNLATKVDKSDVARIENGTSPTTDIEEGEQFYHEGVLYTATQDILTTDTITPNTNCRVSDSVTEQIATLDAQKCDNSVIAKTEEGTTFSKGYVKGDHFIRKGAFCTLTASSVSQGDTITDNTPAQFTTGDVASALPAKEHGTFTIIGSAVTDGFSSTNNDVVKIGNTVNFSARIVLANPINTACAFAQLSFNPVLTESNKFALYSNTTHELASVVYLGASGKLYTYNDCNLAADTYTVSGCYLA
jgi:hypothetical protein